jgi:CRISPR-associated protein (TIGR02584 family)
MSDPRPRNILLITLGGAAGVVTETVWALINERHPPWIPDEIHLVTTTFGAACWRDATSQANRELAALFQYFNLAPVTPEILVPETEEGTPISDIRTEAENIAFANALTWRVMEIKARPNTRLHVSMAGGRKTMSSYSQAAVSYFAEEHDELSHILVEPATLEYSQDFFWPQQRQQEIDVSKRPPPPPPKIVRAASATITLVPSPFPRLRHYVKRIPFAKSNFDHWTLTERMQVKLDAAAALLTLDVASHTLVIGGAPVQLGIQEFALYRILATAVAEGWPGVGADGVGHNHKGWVLIKDLSDRRSLAHRKFFEFYRDCFEGAEDDDYESFTAKIESTLDEDGEEACRDYLAKRFSDLRNKIKRRLMEGVASYAHRRRVTPESKWTREVEAWRYGLALEPHEIEITPRSRD